MKTLRHKSLSVLEWIELPATFPGLRCYAHKASGLRVVEAVGEFDQFGDGRSWHHVSCSYADRLPSWEDLKLVKQRFIGDDRTALQVFPPAAKWISIHPWTLHLWACLEEEIVPDFGRYGTI